MPKCFVETGYDITNLVIDSTELKYEHASNFNISSLMFSNYKNTVTSKALIDIVLQWIGILFSGIYPGSISDSDILLKRVVQLNL